MLNNLSTIYKTPDSTSKSFTWNLHFEDMYEEPQLMFQHHSAPIFEMKESNNKFVSEFNNFHLNEFYEKCSGKEEEKEVYVDMKKSLDIDGTESLIPLSELLQQNGSELNKISSENKLNLTSEIHKITLSSSEKTTKAVRWKRADDIALFKQIKNAGASIDVDYNAFLGGTEIEKDVRSTILSQVYQHSIHSWKTTHKDFIKRVDKKCQNQRFTVREIKLLKRQLKLKKFRDLEFVLDLQMQFPGKTMASLKAAGESLF